MLRRPGVALFDAMLRGTLEENQKYSLLNGFDVVAELYTPDWGEMGLSGTTGKCALRVRKARSVATDSRPYPYTVSPTEGIVVDRDYYRTQVGG